LGKLGIPFVVTALVILLMILLYTFEGGVKTNHLYGYTANNRHAGSGGSLIIVSIKTMGTGFPALIYDEMRRLYKNL